MTPYASLLPTGRTLADCRASLIEKAVKAGATAGQPRELWRWVVLAALALILLEWYIYNRRVYI